MIERTSTSGEALEELVYRAGLLRKAHYDGTYEETRRSLVDLCDAIDYLRAIERMEERAAVTPSRYSPDRSAHEPHTRKPNAA